jgi:hypothetical protein
VHAQANIPTPRIEGVLFPNFVSCEFNGPDFFNELYTAMPACQCEHLFCSLAWASVESFLKYWIFDNGFRTTYNCIVLASISPWRKFMMCCQLPQPMRISSFVTWTVCDYNIRSISDDSSWCAVSTNEQASFYAFRRIDRSFNQAIRSFSLSCAC